MALYYDLTFRGTIASLNWAVVTHWQANVIPEVPEVVICETLAASAVDFWETSGAPLVTTATVLTKVVVQAYDTPLGFAELTTAVLGTAGTDQICPPFAAKGFRQFRSNSDFRTSTHRFPEVREINNVAGSWTYDGGIVVGMTNAVAEWLGNPHSFPIDETITEIEFVPVLLRKQFTTYTEPGHVPVVNLLVPPEVSPVASGGFYGITSQVSRKYIIPT